MSPRAYALIVDRSRAKSWRQDDGSSFLSRHGIATVVVSDRRGAHYEGLPSDTRVHLVESLDHSSIRRVAEKYAPDLIGLSTCSELFVEDVASVRAVLGIPGPQPGYTARLRDKWLMKETAARAGIPTAWGVLAVDAASALTSRPDAARLFLKPRNLSGSRGARELRGTDAATAALDGISRHLEDFVVEEFIDGDLHHIDGFVSGGELAFTLSRYERPTHRAGGTVPLSSHTVDDPVLSGRAATFIRRVLAAWGVSQDVFHCEAFLVDGAFVFCEMAGRPGGAGVSGVFDLLRGRDLRFTKTALDLGLPAEAAPSRLRLRSRAGGWTVFYAPQPGQPGAATTDSGGLSGHVWSDVRHTAEPAVAGYAGVGLATYVFEGRTTAEVRRQIARYESEWPVAPAAGPEAR
ncbi:hypothetical protein ABZ357_23875 [Streptomyces sp. NPDC005917]|uniref:ATP-grasp domain-containing protein n=1 Tax=unclassified Streptomyces TaxID=2593676 RepID=UPI0033DF6EFB